MAPGLLSLAFRVSRFRFWIYTGGTYVVGYAMGMPSWLSFLRPEYCLYLVYFFVPVNLFIYGVNDWWDAETDRLNPKKPGKEHLLAEADRRGLLAIIGAATLVSLLLFIPADTTGRLILAAFLLLSYFYSAPPLRFKSVPFLDSLANVLYLMPGIFAYHLASGSLPPAAAVIAGVAFVWGMHLFSAIPDIGCDRESGIRTTAVLLGERASLILTLALWSVLAATVILASGFYPASLLTLVYPAIPLSLLIAPGLGLLRVYWVLPYLNTTLGGIAFLLFTLSKPALLP